MAKFDQFTNQTGWSDADHCTRFYDGLRDDLKDFLAITDCPTTTFTELCMAAQALDQRIWQGEWEKKGHTFTRKMPQAPFKDPNAMEVDAMCQNSQGNSGKPTRAVYIKKMQGKCHSCGSDKHAKQDCPNLQDICNYCGKVGHGGAVSFTNYMGKPGMKSAGAAASSQDEAPSSSLSSSSANKGKQTAAATTNVSAHDSKAQADLLAKLMAQVREQSEQLKALKSSF